MGFRRRIAAAVLLATWCFLTALSAEDHPLIKPYPGSTGGIKSEREFDEYELVLGPITKEQKPAKSQHLEGKITDIIYYTPEGRSVLEVYRNYEIALKQAGFEVLFSCHAAGCGVNWMSHKGLGDIFPPEENVRLLTAKRSRPEGDVYVALHMASTGGYASINIIEVKPMETGMVAVNAAELASDITRAGHVAVYGIYFDTGKADIKPESDPVLAEMAKLLKENAALKLHVVGHTDIVGALAMNVDLSKRRAAAVMQALVSKHGVMTARLNADGVGPLAPVTTNKTDEGRAKNRRVELVEQ